MDRDDLFTRVERAIIVSRLLRDERRILEQEMARARHALRSAVLEMANLQARIKADRSRCAAQRQEPELPVERDRLECVNVYIESQQDILQTFRKKMLD